MPRKILIIGTLHAGLTPKNELKEILEKIKPDQIFLEIVNDDIQKNDLNSYPPEMVFALKWAKKNNVSIAGFDSKINVFREGATPELNQSITEKQKMLIKNFSSWKDFNNPENEKLLDLEGMDSLVDRKKEKARENEMLENIDKNILENGTILILTGVSHLNFFEQNIKNSILPFRYLHKI